MFNSLRELLLYNLDEKSSLEDLQQYCFGLGIDVENIAGDTKSAKARELIVYLEQRSRLNDLIALGKRTRSDLTWDFVPTSVQASAQAESDAVTKGVNALIQLMQVPGARDAIIVLRSDFITARKQIGSVQGYKKVHDLFQELELHHALMDADCKRAATDPAAWDSLADQAIEAGQVIADLLVATVSGQPPPWVGLLNQARADMQAALDGNDTRAAESALARIKRVLGREPSSVNNRLVASVESLLQIGLLAHLLSTRDRLASLNADARLIGEFTASLDALARLADLLRSLCANHSLWQGVDDELRRIDDNLQDIGELERSWPDVVAMSANLLNESQPPQDWATLLMRTDTELRVALEVKATPKARRLFSQYRSVAERRFRRVDDDLLNVCNELQRIGESLDLLLGVMGT